MVLVKETKKCKLLLVKCSFMVQTKRNREKVVVTKICFNGYTKTEGRCVMENKGFITKMIKMRGNNSMLTAKTALFVKYLGCMLMDLYETSHRDSF